MAIDKKELENKLQKHFPEADIILKDLIGDEDHYFLEIASESFKGKTRVEQHKLVNKALEGCLGTTLHALTIKTIVKA